MLKYYVPPLEPRFQIQTSENDFVEEQASSEYGFWAAYRQLFLFAMRHFFGLTNIQPLALGQTSYKQRFDASEIWRRFKLCAAMVGFVLSGSKSSQSSRLASSIEFTAIHRLLTRLRPPELFTYDEASMTECSNHVASLLLAMTPRKLGNIAASQSWDRIEDWCLEERCGMANSDTFFSDQKYLFLHNIYTKDQPARENMTSFAVKRDIFRSFFLDLDDGSRMDVPAPMDPAPMDPAPMDPAPMDPAPMDVVPVNPTAMDLIPTLNQPQPVSHLRLLSTNNASSNERVTIMNQSPEQCQCQIDMSPDTFYSSCRPFLRNNLDVILFNILDRTVHFIRHYSDDILANLCSDGRWFARVHQDTLALQTLTLDQVSQYCRAGSCIIFHGIGNFNSTLTPVAAESLKLPELNGDQWTV